ncbi:MAG: DUF6882 domain-containing protein [Brevibacterium sp.]
MSTTLQDLVNRAVFYSTEMQSHFGGLIADASWEVDFTADPHLSFTAEDGTTLRTRPHLLGSESSGQNTWLWGWENINEFPEAVVGLSHDVRKFGAAEDVEELITPELDLDDELALRLTLAAKEATGKWAHYPAAAGAGTTVWLLVDAPELALPTPQVKVAVRALMQGLTQTTVTDHRAALDAYVAKRGIPTAELPEGGVRILFADGSADLSFDEQRRISNCDFHAPLEGEAAEQFAKASSTAPAEVGAAPSAQGSEAAASAPSGSPAGGTSAPTAPKRAETGSDAAAVTEDRDAEASATTPIGVASEGSSGTTDQETSAADEKAAAASANDESPTSGSQAAVETPSAASASAGAADSQDIDADEASSSSAGEEPTPSSDAEKPAEDKPKKKGLFSKLFGR